MCIFCAIANKEIPANVIYEDETVVCFLDLSQAGKGHTLIIPKKHYANIIDAEDYDYMYVMTVAKKIATALKIALECDGVNVLTNCGEAAGQTVNHFHVHIIPRFNDDSVTIKWEDNSKKYSEKELGELRDLIRNTLI